MNRRLTTRMLTVLLLQMLLASISCAQQPSTEAARQPMLANANQSTSTTVGQETISTASSSQLRSTLIPTEKSVAMFEARVRKNAKDHASLSVLGRLYMRRAKENDDFHDYILAENTFRHVLELRPTSLGSQAMLAEALMAQHRFKEAKEATQKVLDAKPSATLSLATLGDALMQLGEYEQAENAYQNMLKLSDSPAAIVRMASFHQIRGNIDEALRLIERAAAKQKSVSGEPSVEAWYLWRHASMLLEYGKVEAANQKFNEVLQVDRDYPQALSGLALMEAFAGDNETAIKLYRRALESSEEPPLMIAYGDFLEHIGRHDEATEQFRRAEKLMNEEAQDPQAGPAHARERATYLADHDQELEQALALAQGDLSLRNDVYTQDVLAWAFYKNKQFNLAAKASAQALAQGTRDAKFLYHAGMIEIANGNIDKGKQLLEQAVTLNPCFSIRAVAQVNDILGER